jgi:predicted RecA/RadA family phage recombinase
MMAKNFVQEGDVLYHTCLAAVTSGDVVVIGQKAGVALLTGAIGDVITVKIEGIWNLPKKAGDAFATGGLPVYWDDALNQCTVTVGANVLLGHSVAPVAGAATVMDVRLTEW